MRWRPYLEVIAIGTCIVLIAVGSVFLSARLFFFPDRAPDISDPRACPHSNVDLDRVSSHFGIRIPDDALGLRFSSDVHPLFGDFALKLSFQTTPDGLRTLLAVSGFGPLKKAQPHELPLSTTCPTPGPFSRPLITTDSTRTLLVDAYASTRPYVYITAIDL